MAAIGVDIGEHSTYITVAKQGGVDTIANDFSQRNTPTVVALGGRQRFMGVAAENLKNLYPKNTISYFKNFLGRSFNDEYVKKEIDNIGAEVVELEDGKVAFKVQDKTQRPEEVLAMLLTKVKNIVRASQDEEISTCVISVPLHFTEIQRAAVLDACHIAGLPVNQLMNDTSAMALAYAKSRPEDLATLEEKQPRYMAFVDCGSGGLQSTIVALSKEKATTLASASSTKTGGKMFDNILVDYLVEVIEKKHKVSVKHNKKALNKLRIAAEKIKKQMSANSNKMPLQIESLVEDIDINIELERATFETLISTQLNEIRQTLQSLLDSTTIKKEVIHSVEVVGGSSRIPAVKQIIEDVFGVPPSTGLNADEGVARGCGIQAATLSGKYRTKKFNIQEVVTNGVEAVYVKEGDQMKLVITDEGDNAHSGKTFTINADIPLSLALQYSESVDIANKFISLYQVEGDATKNVDLELRFSMNQNGMIQLERVKGIPKEAAKRRRTSETLQELDSQEPMDASNGGIVYENYKFSVTSMGGLPSEIVLKSKENELLMVEQDIEELSRQEAKNILEEQMYTYRSKVMEESDNIENEETFLQIKEYFDQTENWLYEEGEDAPKQSYEDMLKSLHEKMKVFQMWKNKYKQMKVKEEERRKFVEQEQKRPPQGHPHSRQIPVVYEGTGPYEAREPQRQVPGETGMGHPHQGWVRPPPQDHGYSRTAHPDPFFDSPLRRANMAESPRQRRPQIQEDPFFSRSSLFNDPLFGW